MLASVFQSGVNRSPSQSPDVDQSQPSGGGSWGVTFVDRSLELT